MQDLSQTLVLANKHRAEPEIFYSLQGEGPCSGQPRTFVRLSYCNLTCGWCDTPYTWNWDDKSFEHESGQRYQRSDEQSTLSFSELTDHVAKFPCTNFVVTGGEPMVQQRRLGRWFQYLRSSMPDAQFEIETNATIKPSSEFDDLTALYVCSPKLKNSQVARKQRIVDSAMSFFAQSEKAYFKFVVDQDEDFEEINELLQAYRIPAARVYLMPLGTSALESQSKHGWLAQKCLDMGFNFSPRLHLSLFGDGRGV